MHATPPRLLLADHAVRSGSTVKTAGGGDKVDCQLYDVSKFAEMLQAGSPTCLEALFPDRSGPASSLGYLYESPQWLELKRVRDQLVTPHALRRLVGYLDGQLRQLRKKKGKNWQQQQKPKQRQSADGAGPEEPVPAEFWRLLALLDSLLLDGAQETTSRAPPVASGSAAEAQAALAALAAKCELVAAEDQPGTDDAVHLTLHHWVVNVRSTLLQ